MLWFKDKKKVPRLAESVKKILKTHYGAILIPGNNCEKLSFAEVEKLSVFFTDNVFVPFTVQYNGGIVTEFISIGVNVQVAWVNFCKVAKAIHKREKFNDGIQIFIESIRQQLQSYYEVQLEEYEPNN